MKGLKFITKDELITEYNRLKPKGHWFDKDALKFFNGRVANSAYLLDATYYFISSEKYFEDARRFYTIRSMSSHTADINNIGGFQQHNYSSARKTLAAILGIKVNQL